MIRDYPGTVNVVISGVAASAGSVLALAGAKVEMTPGSLFMCHNPSCIAWGEERDLEDAIHLLRATKDSILNIYARKTDIGRKKLSKMMDATTWLDAEAALEKGFIDGITGDDQPLEEADAMQSPSKSASKSALKSVACIDQREAEAKVRAWVERQKPHARATLAKTDPNLDHNPLSDTQPHTSAPAQPAGVSCTQLEKRLSLLRH